VRVRKREDFEESAACLELAKLWLMFHALSIGFGLICNALVWL
jgi:hypothetical protein